MDSLQNILSELKREIAVALSANEPLPGNAQLEPDRVVVNLDFSLKPDSKELCFDESKWVTGKAPHRISIEFKLSSTERATTDVQGAAPRSNALDGRAVEDAMAELTKVLGKPGFDSSARATVLREACENLSAKDAARLFENTTSRFSIACVAFKACLYPVGSRIHMNNKPQMKILEKEGREVDTPEIFCLSGASSLQF